MTPQDVQDGSLSPDTTKDIPHELQLSKRKGRDTTEAIFVLESTMSAIMDRAQSAMSSTRSLAEVMVDL